MGGPTSSYAAAGIALEFIGALYLCKTQSTWFVRTFGELFAVNLKMKAYFPLNKLFMFALYDLKH
jgi:hypothetical protein